MLYILYPLSITLLQKINNMSSRNKKKSESESEWAHLIFYSNSGKHLMRTFTSINSHFFILLNLWFKCHSLLFASDKLEGFRNNFNKKKKNHKKNLQFFTNHIKYSRFNRYGQVLHQISLYICTPTLFSPFVKRPSFCLLSFHLFDLVFAIGRPLKNFCGKIFSTMYNCLLNSEHLKSMFIWQIFCNKNRNSVQSFGFYYF